MPLSFSRCLRAFDEKVSSTALISLSLKGLSNEGSPNLAATVALHVTLPYAKAGMGVVLDSLHPVAHAKVSKFTYVSLPSHCI